MAIANTRIFRIDWLGRSAELLWSRGSRAWAACSEKSGGVRTVGEVKGSFGKRRRPVRR